MWQQVLSDVDSAQNLIDFSLGWLDQRNYSLTIDTDLSGWVRQMTIGRGSERVNQTFDPRYNPLSPGNSFWMDIREGSHTVAIMAARLFITEDYLGLKRSMKLWFDLPQPGQAELDVFAHPGMPRIHGRVGHEGGLWIHPDHRKRGLSVILPHLNRALCLREWDIDWQTGMTLGDIGKCGIAQWAYGMRHLEPCFEGYFPITRSNDRIYIAYMSREELVAGLDLDAVAGLLPDRHQQPVHAAVRSQKG